MNYILDLQKIKDKLGELKKSSPLWLKKLKENALIFCKHDLSIGKFL